MKINSKLIYNMAFFSIILMYFKILPINIETQPIFIILLIPIFLMLNNKMILSINSEEKNLFIYLYVIIFYFFISLLSGRENSFLYLLKFILGPISYIFLLKNVDLLEIKTLKIMTLLLFLVSFINLTHLPILYNLLNAVLNLFFNRYTVSYIGVRGMCILTPEPSYFVYIAMLLLFSFDFVEYRLKIKEHIFYKILIYSMCILTKSALVYIFLCIYLLFKYLYSNDKINFKHILKNIFIFGIILIFILICSRLSNFNLANNRFFQILRSLNFQNFFDMFFFSDDSSGFRFLINSIYLMSILIRPFGFGFGGMEKQWSNVAKFFNIEYTKNGMFQYSYNASSLLHAQAYFPNVIGAVGIFAIFLISFVYSNNKLDNLKLKYSLIITLTLFLWILQSNMFNPVFWVLIGFCKYNDKKKEDIYYN